MRSRDVAAAPTSRSTAIGKRIAHPASPREPMMRSASEDDDIDEIADESPAAPLGALAEQVVESDTVETIDALAERIRDESGPARKAAIQEAMNAVAHLPPDQAAVLLARLDRTATPPIHEQRDAPLEPTPRGK